VTDCVFRELPTASYGGADGTDDDGGGGEPSFYVGPRDIFPEEFLPFLGLQGRMREFFLQAHGDLLTARFWRGVQERVRSGELEDIYPYREDQRLHHAR
jgi:isocitrate dehydrogenase kinase/phosphatase